MLNEFSHKNPGSARYLKGDCPSETGLGAVERLIIRSRVEFFIAQLKHGREGRSGNRARALERLQFLWEADWLTNEEEIRFRECIWGRLDPKTGMPNLEGGYYPHGVLGFPECYTGQAMKALQEYLENLDLVAIAEAPTENAAKTYPPRLVARLSGVIRAYFHLSKPIWANDADGKSSQYIDWSDAHARNVIEQVFRIWENYRQYVIDYQEVSDWGAMGREDTLICFMEIAGVLVDCMLPCVSTPEDELLNRIEGLLMDMLSTGVPVQRIMPLLVYHKAVEKDYVVSIFLVALKSEHGFVARQAFRGVLEWVRNESVLDATFSGLPRRVVLELLVLIQSERGVARELALDVAADIAKDYPDVFSPEDYIFLESALDTQLETAQAFGRGIIREEHFGFTAAHRLAAAICQRNKNLGVATGGVLSRWSLEEVATSLPETRKIWGLGLIEETEVQMVGSAE